MIYGFVNFAAIILAAVAAHQHGSSLLDTAAAGTIVAALIPWHPTSGT